jgi:hypothetical protein
MASLTTPCVKSLVRVPRIRSITSPNSRSSQASTGGWRTAAAFYGTEQFLEFGQLPVLAWRDKVDEMHGEVPAGLPMPLGIVCKGSESTKAAGGTGLEGDTFLLRSSLPSSASDDQTATRLIPR